MLTPPLPPPPSQTAVRSTEAYAMSPEQFRVFVEDPWGSWENKFAFYAFPSDKLVEYNPNGDTSSIVWEEHDS